MDTSSFKSYETHVVDSKCFHDMYFGAAADTDLLFEVVDFPIKVLYDCVKRGLIKGHRMIDLSMGLNLYQLIAVYKCFSDIIILEVNDGCFGDMEKWLNGEEDAYDWAHAVKVLADLGGCSDNWKEMENDLRSRVKRILKCDLTNENPTDPVILEKADCIISLYVMGAVCKNIDDYSLKLKRLSTMLKKGGCLLIVGSLNATHYTVNGEKFNLLNFGEEDIRKILKDRGYCIKLMEKTGKKALATSVIYEHAFVVCAIKETED
uniref:Nicotinamide N-methyltransferase n=1 Tax=Leptobrachium leishanense TaxID=445787 RepID=A0A8C5WM91_9ANUR